MEDSYSNQLISSDDSCDTEIKNMKSQLTEFGLSEENLSKEEMSDLLQALKNSKESANNDEIVDKVDEKEHFQSPKKVMKRRYMNVRDRRLPWSILPSSINLAEKAQTLAVYVKLMSINTYRQARQSSNFVSWPPPIQIVEETTRVQPLRSTRSGRSVPMYCGFDDDSTDLDFVISKPKKRKVSNSETNNSEVNVNKSLSLKRKPSKDENVRPAKEAKPCIQSNGIKIISSETKVKPKRDLFTLIED
ncbi:uncharacterized protein LOC106137395 isoform X1 [Amyelois transitella]|uniref:uncharacterized protein LOC106137395 isoform X1 n=2 Tax=Amyelois transitella TaxID=680683 RepID=UPI00298F5A01|nr:uncharacterized protein LOC106137395 isoform X1 [Amyelois transitella]